MRGDRTTIRPPAMYKRPSTFLLEALEPRALFAAGAVVGLDDSPAVLGALWTDMEAVGALSPQGGGLKLVLTGSGGGDLTVDFGKLPDTVATVQLRGFDQVTFTGVDRLVNLVLEDVREVTAPDLAVLGSFFATDVDMAEVGSVGSTAVLRGDSMELRVGSGAPLSILTNLSELTVDTPASDVFLLSLKGDQRIALLQVPAVLTVVGIESEQQMTLGGRLPAPEEPPPPTTTEPETLVFVTDPAELSDTVLNQLRLAIVDGGGVSLPEFEALVATLNVAADPSVLAGAAAALADERGRVAVAAAGAVVDASGPTAPAEVVATNVETPIAFGEVAGVLVRDFGAQEDAAGAAVLPAQAEVAVREVTNLSSLVDAARRTVPAESQGTVEGFSVWEAMARVVTQGVNLREYLIGRIVAEIQPGERAAVLLVDPKPSRSSAEQRTATR